MKAVKIAQASLNILKTQVIGLFYIGRSMELVVAHNDKQGTVNTLFITPFGAIQQTFGIPVEKGQFKLFPDGRNMQEMIDNPFLWEKFVKSFTPAEELAMRN